MLEFRLGSSFKRLLGFKEELPLTVTEQLNIICDTFPYNHILAEQKIEVEYFHSLSGLALVRDDSTEVRYVAEIKYTIDEYKIKMLDKVTQYKIGDLDINIAYSFRMSRVSTSTPLYSHRYLGDSIYKDYLNYIRRFKHYDTI